MQTVLQKRRGNAGKATTRDWGLWTRTLLLLRAVIKNLSNARKDVVFFIFLIVLSLFVRLVGQPNYPDCLHRDEVQFGYNAYSLVTTGRDEWGEFLPLHFKFNGEYHVPSVFYLIALVMAFTGPTDTAIRLPAIMLSAVMPVLGYYFVKELTGNKKVGYIVAILLAINPWQIIHSRGSGEISIISQFFGIAGFCLLFTFLKKSSIKYLVLTCLSFIAAYFSYIASRLDIPLLLSVFVLLHLRRLPRPKISIPILVFLIILPFVLVALYPKRFVGTSIISKHFSPEDETQKQQLAAAFSQSKPKFYVSQTKEVFFEFVDNYFDYLSPHYIFRSMGEPDRTDIKNIGSIYLVEAITVVLGLFTLSFKDAKKRWFFISWLILAPVVGALTHNYPDRPNSARTVYFYFSVTILSAFGFYFLHSLASHKRVRKFLYFGIVLAFIANIGYFANQYLRYSPVELTHARGCGFKELFATTQQLGDQYREVQIGTEYDYPYVQYLWYAKYPPAKYHTFLANNPPENEIVFIDSKDKHNWTLENYTFVHRYCLNDQREGTLLVGNFQQCKDKYQMSVVRDIPTQRVVLVSENGDQFIYREVGQILHKDGKVAFNLYTYDKNLDSPITSSELARFTPATY